MKEDLDQTPNRKESEKNNSALSSYEKMQGSTIKI